MLDKDAFSIFLTAIWIPVALCFASCTSPYEPLPSAASRVYINSKSLLVMLLNNVSSLFVSAVIDVSSYPSLINGVDASIR